LIEPMITESIIIETIQSSPVKMELSPSEIPRIKEIFYIGPLESSNEESFPQKLSARHLKQIYYDDQQNRNLVEKKK